LTLRGKRLSPVFSHILFDWYCPRGVIDYENHIPSADLTVIATTNGVVARKETHPAIIDLLLQAMQEEHSGASILHPADYFPTQTDPEYPMAQRAIDFYKNGPSVLLRCLPFWMVTHVQRLLAALLGSMVIVLPLFNFGPKMYMWFLRERMSKLYGGLRSIEKQLQKGKYESSTRRLSKRIEKIDYTASHLWIPTRHSALLFSLKVHCNLIRTRLVARLAEVRAQAVKAA
jgi:hypothetical protein